MGPDKYSEIFIETDSVIASSRLKISLSLVFQSAMSDERIPFIFYSSKFSILSEWRTWALELTAQSLATGSYQIVSIAK